MAEINPTPTPTPDVTPHHTHTPNIPQADIDLKDLAILISAKWAANPLLTLMWTDPEAFDTIVTNYDTTLNQRIVTGGTRPDTTNELKKIDHEVDTSAKHLKDYLSDKYTLADAPSFYPQFGIIKKNKHYIIPDDRNVRKNVLENIIPAISLHGFQNNKYGLAYWTDLSHRYTTLVGLAVTTDGTVSTKVSTKNVLKKDIKKTLNALINLIKANYPETYKGELRAWGFQKEKY